MFHLYFILIDIIQDTFCDVNNLEEASSLARMIQDLNPKLVNKKGKEAFYAFKAVYHDIYVAMLSEFFRSFNQFEDLDHDCTPDHIKNLTNDQERQQGFVQLFRSFIVKTHLDFEKCEKPVVAQQLPPFYPHHKSVRAKETKLVDHGVKDVNSGLKQKAICVKKVKEDFKNSYSESLLSVLGSFFLLIDSAKQGNGLLTFIIQKKLLKPIQQTGHKNYAVSLLSYKHTVLGHRNAQFAHQYMWNTSAGGRGKGNKFPRDQKVEHLNRFLKDSFRSLGPNLNPVTAKRVNNSSDFAIRLEEKLASFFELSDSGNSHTLKDHTIQVKKICSTLRREGVTDHIPGRKFKGPKLQANFFNSFDEVKFRTWHLSKDKELYRCSSRYRSSHLY